MALPKEPRQKMINLMYLVLTALLAMNVSSEILNAFKVVDTSLRTSNDNLKKANNTLYASLEENLKDAKTAEKAKIWEPKAATAKQLSENLYNYIDDLKKQLKEASGLTKVVVDGKEKESFKEDNLDAASRLFDTNGKGKELESKLAEYKKAMLAIDPLIGEKFSATLPIDTDPPVGEDGTKKDFTNAYFHMTPTVAGLTLLSKFQNNVKNAENQVVSFCTEQIGKVVVKFDKTGVLVGQSTNYVMPGDKIDITAGIGAYSSAAQPQITIAGQNTPVVDGKATYTTTGSGAGSKSVTVSVTYLDQDGVKQTKTEEVKYTVGTPGSSAVMLDKMNVFYIGVDNPVTISSGSGWDKTKATISGAGSTMTGEGSSRIVRVKEVGKATINVAIDGKAPTPFEFRVKRIPDPIIKVGPSGGGKMQAIVFRSQKFVRADLENFDFAAEFKVVSATIYFQIPGVRNAPQVNITSGDLTPAKQYLDQLVPGSAVIFDNIKVVGPDGQPRTIQNPPGFTLF